MIPHICVSCVVNTIATKHRRGNLPLGELISRDTLSEHHAARVKRLPYRSLPRKWPRGSAKMIFGRASIRAIVTMVKLCPKITYRPLSIRDLAPRRGSRFLKTACYRSIPLYGLGQSRLKIGDWLISEDR